MSRSQGHEHHHAHEAHAHHAHAGFGRAFAIGIGLNTAFVIIEAIYGWRAGSLALLADAGHNLSDVGGLIIAWAALVVGRRAPTERNTYGLRRGPIIAGFANAVILLVAMGSLVWEALARLQSPPAVAAGTMMVVAGIGVVINTITALLFHGAHKSDVNIRGAYLHMAADALVSLAVVVSGALYLWQGWVWIDPVISLVIALVIVVGTWSLFRQSLHLLFDGVPAHIELAGVRKALLELPGVDSLHDLHVWALASLETALTAHVVLAPGTARDTLLHDATAMLQLRFGIAHVTLQVESAAYAAECEKDMCKLV